MITLFIDTSSSDVSIAIIKGDKILSNINKKIPNQHSVYTVDFIDKCLKEANLLPSNIEKIMVVQGPGSFTGVRIGVTIAKVYAYLKKIPIITVSSLKMLALSCEHEYCLSLINARHNNYYFGLYDKDNSEVFAEQFGSKEVVLDLIERYNPILVTDDDFYLDGDIFVKKQDLHFCNIVSYYQNFDSLNVHFVVPNYLKLPQALELSND